jgi:hypothetical protein
MEVAGTVPNELVNFVNILHRKFYKNTIPKNAMKSPGILRAKCNIPRCAMRNLHG